MPLWITISLMLYTLVACGLFGALAVFAYSPDYRTGFAAYILIFAVSLIWPLWAIYYLFRKKDNGRVA